LIQITNANENRSFSITCGSILPLKINYIQMKKIIRTPKAPAAIGPYSQAVEINGTLYISGQLGVDPKTGSLVEGGITRQTQQIFRNIEAILEEAGYTFKDVVKSTCLLSDIKDFKAMNEEYGRIYTQDPPARSTYAVRDLPLGALLEIETIAAK
jgi:2-iminobutanoate/2-iminopropanoate deaminase